MVGQIQDPTFAEPTKSLGFAHGWSPELHDDLIGRGQLGVAPSSGHLIGRSRECRVLDNLLDSVRDGHSGVLVVRGEAGSGKSALLQHLISSAGGFRIVSATGVESEMELPFAGLHQLCLSMLDDVDSLPAPQRDAAHVAFGLQPGAAPDRLLIGLGVLNLLSAVAEEKPLLCIVDDAQWLDRASIDALTFVSRRLLADQVALVFSTRLSGTELSDFTELTVEGLSEGDAEALLNSLLHVAN